MTCRRDSAGLGAVTDPLGHTTTRTYDAVSRLVTQTDPLGRLTWYAYDSLNRLATRTGRVSAPRAVKVLGCVPQA